MDKNKIQKKKSVEEMINFIAKKSTLHQLFETNKINDIDTIHEINIYERDGNRRGLIVEVQEKNLDVRSKIMIDLKQGQPIINQVYDALYGIGKDCSKRIIMYSGGKNDYDSGIPTAVLWVMELVLRNLHEYPLAISLCKMDEKSFLTAKTDTLIEDIFDEVYKSYRTKSELIANKAYPVIRDVYEGSSQYENIAIPITDGKKVMQIIANLKKSYETEGKDVAISIDKGVTLATIDDSWKEHLREMDDLKQSVQAATYEQKDPLLIYKFESFELFKIMLEKINKESISFIIKGNLPVQKAENVKEAQMKGRGNLRNLKEERTDLLSQSHSDTQQQQKSQPVKVEKKVGRNEPCPCGSGKKYKHCHGKGK